MIRDEAEKDFSNRDEGEMKRVVGLCARAKMAPSRIAIAFVMAFNDTASWLRLSDC